MKLFLLTKDIHLFGIKPKQNRNLYLCVLDYKFQIIELNNMY